MHPEMRKTYLENLNTTCKEAFSESLTLCNSQTNYYVEIEHWLLPLVQKSDTDLVPIFRQYEINPGHVVQELTKAIDGLKKGNDRGLQLSDKTFDLMRESWVLTSLQFRAAKIRSGYLLTALLLNRDLRTLITDSAPSLGNINAEELLRDVRQLIEGSAEEKEETSAFTGTPTQPGQVRPGSKTPNLDQFTLNLTERARDKEIDPVIGRDFEIRQVIDILTRRRQNNPILTGEAGVGKTAVVEGFALEIIAGNVPGPLKNVDVRTLDLGLLQAGAGVKGEFENRLKNVIAEVKASPKPIILFIDEAHTIIGAGGAAGQGDAANLLKPALARGELRTIAATTWMEYKKYFETDAALKRRFQVVKVDEPNVEQAIRMMRGLSDTLEHHHKVRILEEAIADAVRLSHRYITDRQLPDKSVSLLDTAGAKVALSQTAIPALIQDCRRELEMVDVEIAKLERETAFGGDHAFRMEELTEQKTHHGERLAKLEKQWEEEKRLVAELQEIRNKLEGIATDENDKPIKLSAEQESKCKEDLLKLEGELEKVQGEEPLVFPVVGGQAVAEVVSGWTGIPVGRMVRDEIQAVLSLKDRLEERVVGQGHALDKIAQRIRTSRANLADPRRPIGVFLLVGPSGVGKTETAVALAEILFGGDRNMVTVNMSEYKEEHKVSRLTGSAPGYVGYGEGGVLTEAVRRKPYSVVLLDEVEKANESVQEIFYQVFDKGMLQDDKGNEVDFKNTIILLTSNVGTETIMKVCADPDTCPDPEGLATALREDLLKSFKPALLGRMHVIPYYPLSDEVMRMIIKLQLKRIADRTKHNHRAALTYDDHLVDTIAGRCKEVETGARNVDHILTGTLLPEMAGEFLVRMADNQVFEKVHVGVDDEGKFVYEIS